MVKEFDSAEFQTAYHTQLPLGTFCSREGTLFRLWAPTAQQVMLRLYQAGAETAPERTFFMQPGDKGVWEHKMPENLDGIYYDYAVQTDGKSYETPDPYCTAAGVNGQRSMVLDLCRTDPEGWQQDKAPEKTA